MIDSTRETGSAGAHRKFQRRFASDKRSVKSCGDDGRSFILAPLLDRRDRQRSGQIDLEVVAVRSRVSRTTTRAEGVSNDRVGSDVERADAEGRRRGGIREVAPKLDSSTESGSARAVGAKTKRPVISTTRLGIIITIHPRRATETEREKYGKQRSFRTRCGSQGGCSSRAGRASRASAKIWEGTHPSCPLPRGSLQFPRHRAKAAGRASGRRSRRRCSPSGERRRRT